MLIIIVVIAILVVYFYYKKQKQIPQDNNEQCTNDTCNNNYKQITAYNSASVQSKSRNTTILDDSQEIIDIKKDGHKSIQTQAQDIKANKNCENNSELFTIEKEKIK